MQQLAAGQRGSSKQLAAPRGRIESRDGYPLAMDKEGYMAYIDPQNFRVADADREQIAVLIPASDSARKALTTPASSGLSWVSLGGGLSPQAKKQIEALNPVGLGFDSQPIREYLSASASANITGFVGKDSEGYPQGYFGLEGFYNRTLFGKPGRLTEDVDALGRSIVIAQSQNIPAQAGQDLITSIDRTVQYVAFRELEKGLKTYQAASGTVSVMESKTGRILALVSLPSYDPEHYSEYDESLYSNPIVSDGYEPGSTFKTVVMAAGLDAKVVSPDTQCDACSGPQTISAAVVRNYNDKYYPGTTMTDVILHSDNIGMIFVSRKLGKARMLDYLRKFGFGQLTGIDLQEEDTPKLRPDNEWYDIDWATAAFGQGIAVTRIQMLTAVNAIANGGKLLPPRIVTAIRTGENLKPVESPKPRQVISAAAAEMTKQMLVNAVAKGEVRYYQVPGYAAAGKTGTAQVPIAGHYDPNKVIASYVGFAPADDPKFTMLVTLREPKLSPWGSTTAAPLWFNIARELFRYYKIPPASH